MRHFLPIFLLTALAALGQPIPPGPPVYLTSNASGNVVTFAQSLTAGTGISFSPSTFTATGPNVISVSSIVGLIQEESFNTSIPATPSYNRFHYTGSGSAVTLTLPANAGFTPGSVIIVDDTGGGVTGTNTLTCAPFSGDTINGSASSQVINTARGWLILDSDGLSNWTIVGSTQSAGGVTSITGTANQITASASTGAVTLSMPGAVTIANSLNLGGTAYSFGALPSGAGTTGAVLTEPATTYTVTGTNTATYFGANYEGIATVTDASAGTVTDLFHTILAGPAAGAGSLTVTRAHTLGILDGTVANLSTSGALIVATTFGTSGTSTAIGGGQIFTGGSINAGGLIKGAVNSASIGQQIQASNSNTGVGAGSQVWATNSADTTIVGITSTGYTATLLTNQPASGEFGHLYTNANIPLYFGTNTHYAGSFDTSQNFNLFAKVAKYNNVATAGWGVPAIQGYGRQTAQSAADASVATYTVGAADGSFIVSANVLVTTSTTHAFTVTCAYTDEGNTPRVVTLQFSNLAGTFITSIANAAGAVPYEGVPLHIRCKAATTITIASAAGGVYTSVVYNIEGQIQQID